MRAKLLLAEQEIDGLVIRGMEISGKESVYSSFFELKSSLQGAWGSS